MKCKIKYCIVRGTRIAIIGDFVLSDIDIPILGERFKKGGLNGIFI